jgi:undecaprenyl-diphosphatase
VAEAVHAAEEVASGEVGRASRPWLAALALVAFAGFALDSYAVATVRLLPFDVPLALLVQRVQWGPLALVMELTNWLAGAWQVALGAAVVVVMAVMDRRAGWLMAVGSVASLLDNLVKLLFERHRPTADLVHILSPASGYSYPSGHAVFFTWLSFMVAFSLAPMVRPRLRPLLWALAAFVVVMACVGRVWAGVHWPSDVLGGLLLALGWSAFVLWLPERWLPQPSRRWLGLGVR